MKNEIEKDIAIVGAGLAGVCAAVSCARQGRRVVLIEKNSFPGGIAVILQHRMLCGLYPNTPQVPAKFLNKGITPELCRLLAPGQKPLRVGRVWVLPFDPARLVLILTAFLKREKNIEVLYDTEFKSCACENNNITVVTLNRRSRGFILRPRIIIDAGTGSVVQKAGAVLRLESNEKLQLAGYTILVGGVLFNEELAIRVPYCLRQAVREGLFERHAQFTLVYPGMKKSELYIKYALPPGTDILVAKRLAVDVFKFLRHKIPDFRHSHILWQAKQVCERDCARLSGAYVMKARDVLSGRKFSDAVISGAWPVEYWDKAGGPRYSYVANGHYQVPPGALRAKRIKNLFAAGRSTAADGVAAASLRAGGMCMATGEAAGRAAAEQRA
jgi:hypothetical protein